jgi:hypothetical protein
MMRKIISMLLLWFVLLIPVSVQAQAQLHLSLVSVDIWPEYDRAAVLTIDHITLAPDTVLPARFTLRLPLGAEINAVAIANTTGNLINAPYDSTNQSAWSVLTITTTSLQVQVEYYTALVKDGITRHISYDWAGDYAVDKLEVNFLRPLGAGSPTISLPSVEASPGQDGLTNYRMEAADLKAGMPFALRIDYQRQTDALSISSLPVQAASTPGPDTPGHVSMTGLLPWVLVGIGLLLIGAGITGFVVWQRGNQVTRTIKRQKPRLTKEGENEFIYCSQCGKRAQPGDVFCRTCGTRLKRGATD